MVRLVFQQRLFSKLVTSHCTICIFTFTGSTLKGIFPTRSCMVCRLPIVKRTVNFLQIHSVHFTSSLCERGNVFVLSVCLSACVCLRSVPFKYWNLIFRMQVKRESLGQGPGLTVGSAEVKLEVFDFLLASGWLALDWKALLYLQSSQHVF